ncbi:hypothetical protein [Geodermatophilus sp. SYSU D00815]
MTGEPASVVAARQLAEEARARATVLRRRAARRRALPPLPTRPAEAAHGERA